MNIPTTELYFSLLLETCGKIENYNQNIGGKNSICEKDSSKKMKMFKNGDIVWINLGISCKFDLTEF